MIMAAKFRRKAVIDIKRMKWIMRVMTFNLRFENDRDGQNSWICRRDLVVNLIKEHGPDILGTQEGRVSQLTYLDEQLTQYEIHTPSRVLDDTCQYPTLFFRKGRFRILKGEEFWLSRTPNVHRSKNWDSAFPRMMSTAKAADLTSGRVFQAAVTHLDHMGKKARLCQAQIIARWVQDENVPVILMGDFNDGPASRTHAALANRETGLSDTWQVLGHGEGSEYFTHHAFSGVPQKDRIDWILISRSFTPVNARMVHDHLEGRYASDHFPYYADLKWGSPERM